MNATPNTVAEIIELGVRIAHGVPELRPTFDTALHDHPRWRDALRVGIAAQLDAHGYVGADAAARALVSSANGKHPHEGAPSLADIWSGSLDAFLDPDPFLLRPSHAGMGTTLDRMLGGGLSPGQTLTLGAFGAGGGKTAFVHQWADGIASCNARAIAAALESDEKPVVTPIVYASEMSLRDITLRSLARQANIDGYLLRDPKGERGRQLLVGTDVTEGEMARQVAVIAADEFRGAAETLTVLDRSVRANAAKLRTHIQQVRQYWESRGAVVLAVALFVDPVHQLIDRNRTEVEGIGDVLDQLLAIAQSESVMSILTSETKFAAARERKEAGGKKQEELADMVEQAFRGSYELMHMPDAAMGLVTLRPDDEYLEPEEQEYLRLQPEGTLYAEVVSPKARWQKRGQRAAYHFHAAQFRFRPVEARRVSQDRPLRERVVEYVARHPLCSGNQVADNVVGRRSDVLATIQLAVQDGELVEQGIGRTRRLQINQNGGFLN